MQNGPHKHIRRTSNRFAEVPKANISRSTFNRSHGLKTTFDSGLLVPIYVDEALPGDTFTMSMNGFIRMSTPLHPVMDNLYADTHFWFVPNRLLWSAWPNFMGEEESPGDDVDYLVPRLNSGTIVPEGTIGDYMGLPTGQVLGQCNALHLRAYNLVWSEHYRDQNLQERPALNTGDGPDNYADYQLLRRGKRHDYFTSALPFLQKGDPVTIPIGTRADVTFDGNFGDPVDVQVGATGPVIRRLTTEIIPPAINENVVVDSVGDGQQNVLYANLASATAATINELRQAFQVQKLLERDARGGTRYTEIIKSHFGVTSPDARLQRPEYLGGGTTMISINPVANTAGGDGTTLQPTGTLGAIGTAAWSGHGWHKSFTEHGVLIGLVSIRADLTYQQRLDRMWWRQTRLDYFWPALQHLGEQEVYQGELEFVSGTENGVWAFQERHAEYRFKPSNITGAFRSNAAQPLHAWHFAQDFGGVVPPLNDSFIQEAPEVNRALAIKTEPEFIADMWFNLKCARPMPVYGVPGFIDHF